MAGISKCNDTSCPSRHHCYRFTAPASKVWQSYNDFQRGGRAYCSSYWPVEGVAVFEKEKSSDA